VPSRPTITVVVTSYNLRGMLRDALDSVLAQTRAPEQVLVIDDASTDGSHDLIDEYDRSHPGRFEIIVNGRNTGISAVRALAIERATGDLVTMLDGDDAFFPEKLAREGHALALDQDAGFAFSDFVFTDERLDPGPRWGGAADHDPSATLRRLVKRDYPRGVCYRAELVRTELVRAAGSYRADLSMYEDLDCKIRVAARSRGVAIDEPLHAYRLRPGGYSHAPAVAHFEALAQIFARDNPMISALDRRTRRAADHIVSRYAWNALRAHTGGRRTLTRDEYTRVVRAAIGRRPLSALRPDDALRLVRGWFAARP